MQITSLLAVKFTFYSLKFTSTAPIFKVSQWNLILRRVLTVKGMIIEANKYLIYSNHFDQIIFFSISRRNIRYEHTELTKNFPMCRPSGEQWKTCRVGYKTETANVWNSLRKWVCDVEARLQIVKGMFLDWIFQFFLLICPIFNRCHVINCWVWISIVVTALY